MLRTFGVQVVLSKSTSKTAGIITFLVPIALRIPVHGSMSKAHLPKAEIPFGIVYLESYMNVAPQSSITEKDFKE